MKTLTLKKSKEITGGIGFTTKTGFSYGLPARKACKVGCRLAKEEGSACFGCYATGGNYQYPSVKTAHDRRLDSVKGLNKDTTCLWVEAMVTLISNKALKNPKDMWFFRWHDSGDLVSTDHLKAIAEVARRTPEIKHWLPTKEVDTVKEFLKTEEIPDNLTIRLSSYYIDKADDFGLDIPIAVVYTKDLSNAHLCPAIQNHKGCRGNNCRACWKKSVKTVGYQKHR